MIKFEKFKKLNQLKEIERMTKVNTRSESPAEHTWACLIYAEYFFKVSSVPLNEEKVRKLLLYHDIVEIEAGDIPEIDIERRKGKEEHEQKAFTILKENLPSELHDEYTKYFEEFEMQETLEAKFAYAIDKIEPMIHQLNNKSDWKYYGYTEKVLWEVKGQFMQPFPELLNFYKELILYLKENNFIDEE